MRGYDRGMSRSRLVDVAQLAGVSIKTVSNVVNGNAHVSPQMRSRVTAAIEELHYVPNLTARTLKTGRTGIIALALPDLSVPYFAELAKYVTEAAERRGYTILVDQTEGRADRERLVAKGLRNHVIDGLIFSPLAMGVSEIAEAADGTPMVLLGECRHPANMDHVAIDNVGAAAAATRHLLRIGRRRIAAVGAPLDRRTGTGALRVEGYRSALVEAGHRFDPELVIATTDFHRSEGVRAIEQLLALSEPPDAVFCCNDLLALGVLYAARRHGLTVPTDLAVAGFDDIEETRFSNPTLTTISPDKQRIACIAVDLLVRRLEHRRQATLRQGASRPEASREVFVDYELVERESTLGVDPSAAPTRAARARRRSTPSART